MPMDVKAPDADGTMGSPIIRPTAPAPDEDAVPIVSVTLEADTDGVRVSSSDNMMIVTNATTR